MIDTEKINPGAIVVLLNSSKENSSLANTKAIDGFPLVSIYGRYEPGSKQIHYSTIKTFKGLEADVILLVLKSNLTVEEQANALYVQGSRAKHLLYVYHRETN